MKKQAAILMLISLILTACNQNKPNSQIPEVDASVDSAAIAQDTFQQKSLEESYEYAQTVVVNPKLVYDIRAYGGPASHGEYCIIRRGADNKPDTVVTDKRFGIFINAFSADLNKNGKEEIYIVTRNADTTLAENIIAFEFDNRGKATNIDIHFEPLKVWNYRGIDSIYLSGKEYIGRLFPLFNKNNEQDAWMRIDYRLIKTDLYYSSAEMIKHY